jgi:hypothetical protein
MIMIRHKLSPQSYRLMVRPMPFLMLVPPSATVSRKYNIQKVHNTCSWTVKLRRRNPYINVLWHSSLLTFVLHITEDLKSESEHSYPIKIKNIWQWHIWKWWCSSEFWCHVDAYVDISGSEKHVSLKQYLQTSLCSITIQKNIMTALRAARTSNLTKFQMLTVRRFGQGESVKLVLHEYAEK